MSVRWLLAFVPVAFLLVPNQAAWAEEPVSKTRSFTDKTLVAWVYLGDLEQRGGSALTLFDDK